MQEKSILVIDSPKNCLTCQLHILTVEGKNEFFSCAGYKGHGTLNPEFDFLNTYNQYSKGTAPNCALINITYPENEVPLETIKALHNDR